MPAQEPDGSTAIYVGGFELPKVGHSLSFPLIDIKLLYVLSDIAPLVKPSLIAHVSILSTVPSTSSP